MIVRAARFFLIFFVFLLFSCSRSVSMDQQVHAWSGRFVQDSRPVYFREILGNGLVLNFYSPSCIPCIEELPALEALYQQGRRQGTPLLIVVFPELLEGSGEKIAVLRQDITRHKIRMPMVLLDSQFSIEPSSGSKNYGGRPIITGTPETIFFRGGGVVGKNQETETPLGESNKRVAVYNFVGPIAVGNMFQTGKDVRFRFVQKKLAELAKIDNVLTTVPKVPTDY